MERDGMDTPWLVRPAPRENAGLRLFCLPFAGGSALFYRTWPQELPDSIEVCAVELPGRGRRIRETPYNDLPTLVQALAPAIRPFLERPFAFFGHSFGALVAFELARAVRDRYETGPVLLCVSGARAPHLPAGRPHLHRLPKRRLLEEVRRLGGTPAAVLEIDELVSLVLPAIRADFAALETYVFVPVPPLSCPILAVGGVEDDRASPPALEAWAEHTTARFKVDLFPGGHFYIQRPPPPFWQTLGQALQRAALGL